MATLPSPVSISFSAFLSLVRTPSPYTLFPLYQTLDADLDTPVSVYLKLAHSSPTNSFLLESVKNGEYQSRFSYIGTDPSHVLTQDDVDPLLALEREMSLYTPYPTPALPDFTGGAVGYVAYDCVGQWERKVPVPPSHPLGTPQSVFLFCPSMVILDHVKQSMHVVSHVHIPQAERGLSDERLRERYDEAVRRLSVLLTRLAAPLPSTVPTSSTSLPSPPPSRPSLTSPSASSPSPSHHGMTSNVGVEGYRAFVNALRDHIVQGNIIQAVPSQRLSRPLQPGVTAFDIYRSLRVVNPSPYMFYLDLGSFQICGASPEQLVKVEGGRVTTHPIAGTRRRGRTKEEDEALERELVTSEKERAEHIMLVDLGRNDLGRVCTPGTVQVDSLMHVEKYSHVMHIVSVVSGRLAQGRTAYDAFRSVFPAGTVSGAPKIRAMQLIAGLEREQRGVYAGAVGFVSYSGTLDTAIAIRTLLVKDGQAILQAGAGIVYDSEPVAEEKETVKKMMALVRYGPAHRTPTPARLTLWGIGYSPGRLCCGAQCRTESRGCSVVSAEGLEGGRGRQCCPGVEGAATCNRLFTCCSCCVCGRRCSCAPHVRGRGRGARCVI